MDKETLNRDFKKKTWNEIKTKDSWQLFKLMSEFVNGFEKMSRIGPCVTIFGSASQYLLTLFSLMVILNPQLLT